MSIEIRREIVRACRVLAANGHSDTVLGHVSARDPDGRGIWMKAGKLGFEEVTEHDVLLLSWDGAILEGEGWRHLEYPIHTELIRADGRTGSVVHSHPPHGTAMAAAGNPLDPISHLNGVFAQGVPVCREAVGLIDSPQSGRRLAAEIAGHRALLLAGHGIVTTGPSVGSAVAAAVLLERACELQMITNAFGGVADWLAAKDPAREYPHAATESHLLDAWAYLVRRVEITTAA
jgi:L-fuculose-phosphate aldolase